MLKKNEALHGAIVRLNDSIQGNHVRYPNKLYLIHEDTGYLCDPGDDLEILYGIGKFHLNWLVCSVRPLKNPDISGYIDWEKLSNIVDLISPGQKFVSPWKGHTAIKPVDIGDGTTAAGLHLSKNGRLKYPIKGNYSEDIPYGYTAYGQAHPKPGDFVCDTSNGMLSAGTVGRIISENTKEKIHGGSYQIQMLDGAIKGSWRYGVGLMTEQQVQEVVDFYVADGRANRVFVKF